MTEELECSKHFLDFVKGKCIQNALKSPCMRMHYGAVIFREGKIISEGFNYPVFGSACIDSCIRDELKVHHGTRLELCWAVHAEQSAILKAGREADGAYLMVVGIKPDGKILWRLKKSFYCSVCARFIIGAGISKIFGITKDGYCVMTPAEAMKYSMKISMGEKVFNV